MKKILSLILALCMILALTACSGGLDAGKLDEISAAVSSLQAAVNDLAAKQAAAAEEAAAAVEEIVEEAPAEEPAEALAPAEIQVFIAASLDNAFQDIVALYSESRPDVTVTLNPDSSGQLLVGSLTSESAFCDTGKIADRLNRSDDEHDHDRDDGSCVKDQLDRHDLR